MADKFEKTMLRVIRGGRRDGRRNYRRRGSDFWDVPRKHIGRYRASIFHGELGWSEDASDRDLTLSYYVSELWKALDDSPAEPFRVTVYERGRDLPLYRWISRKR